MIGSLTPNAIEEIIPDRTLILPNVLGSEFQHTTFQPGKTDAQLFTLDVGIQDFLDLTGNGSTSSQLTTDKQPVLTANAINGHPAALFDGSNDLLNGTVLGLDNYTQFIVAQRNSNAPQNHMLSGLSGKALDSIFGNATNLVRIFQGVTIAASSTSTVSIGQPHIITATSTLAGDVELFFNGKLEATGNQPHLGSSGFVYQIGAALNINFFDGFIGEVIGYNRILTITEIQLINNYLSRKWGIGLQS